MFFTNKGKEIILGLALKTVNQLVTLQKIIYNFYKILNMIKNHKDVMHLNDGLTKA